MLVQVSVVRTLRVVAGTITWSCGGHLPTQRKRRFLDGRDVSVSQSASESRVDSKIIFLGPHRSRLTLCRRSEVIGAVRGDEKSRNLYLFKMSVLLEIVLLPSALGICGHAGARRQATVGRWRSWELRAEAES